jgi:glycosyltransferase involved in cell wall biosynthesis
MGKPLICFDTGGYTHYFRPEYSRVIKGVKSRTEAVERLARAMAELADRELIAQMGAEAKRRSEELSWEKKIESIVNSQGSIDNSPVGTT